MTKTKQLFLTAMISSVSAVAMEDMGRISHSTELKTEEAPAQSPSGKSQDMPSTLHRSETMNRSTLSSSELPRNQN